MPIWTADIELTLPLVEALIAEQFPGLRHLPIEPAGEGWDNAVFCVGQRWLFRFPRRQVAVAGVTREIVYLPRLKPKLPLAIPFPQWMGSPTKAYPWPFFGYEGLAGRELSDWRLSETTRHLIAAPLGRFLKALHEETLAQELGSGLPWDPCGRLDFTIREKTADECLQRLQRMGESLEFSRLRVLVQEAATVTVPRLERIAHGDLHFRHLLLSDKGALTGIVDWGDLQLNHPAVDLQLYWSLLPPTARGLFESAYGPVSETTKRLARGVAVYLNALLLEYALHEKRQAITQEARAALALTCVD